MNGINVDLYKASVVELFRKGGGKGLNHFYTGEPSSGKTALVRFCRLLFPALTVVRLWSSLEGS